MTEFIFVKVFNLDCTQDEINLQADWLQYHFVVPEYIIPSLVQYAKKHDGCVWVTVFEDMKIWKNHPSMCTLYEKDHELRSCDFLAEGEEVKQLNYVYKHCRYNESLAGKLIKEEIVMYKINPYIDFDRLDGIEAGTFYRAESSNVMYWENEVKRHIELRNKKVSLIQRLYRNKLTTKRTKRKLDEMRMDPDSLFQKLEPAVRRVRCKKLGVDMKTFDAMPVEVVYEAEKEL